MNDVVKKTPSIFITGLDLGQTQQFTAFAAVEQRKCPDPNRSGREINHYDIRHLERFALGTSYTDIAARLKQRFEHPTLQRSMLAIDYTGVGQSVVHMLSKAGIDAHIRPVLITAGNHAARDGHGGWTIGKVELVGMLQVLLQTRRIKVAQGLPHAPTLMRELQDFRTKVKLSSNEMSADWREGIHDDLVLAVAIAIWEGEHRKVFAIW
jgi:hypothetical protein